MQTFRALIRPQIHTQPSQFPQCLRRPPGECGRRRSRGWSSSSWAIPQASYHKFSPHRYVRNWKTPLLVIHGEKDFRVPITQGIEAFQAAQIEGVPSRFLYFPTEGHWVQSPQNGVVWHRVFFEWLEEHVK